MHKSKPFGLIIRKRAKAFPSKFNAIFDVDSDEETSKKPSTKIPRAKPLPKKLLEAEMSEDPSMYEYDSIYDEMKAKEVAKSEDRPPRYIDSLLKAADKHKKNYERRIERKIQYEREKEGDKFKDKESFVTSAYKKKLEERERREQADYDISLLEVDEEPKQKKPTKRKIDFMVKCNALKNIKNKRIT